MVNFALLAFLRFKGRAVTFVVTVLTIVGIAVVLSSGTPFPVWVYVVWATLAFACLVFLRTSRPFESTLKSTRGAVAFFWLLSIGLCALEAPYHVTPKIELASGQRIFVIGDSITAGLGQHETTWPVLMAQSGKLDVLNLAGPGATVASAMKQIKGITVPHSMVILEIGGNDLLGFTTAAEFQTGLEALLRKLSEGGHTLVMFELPLPPFRDAFGRVQRSLAAKYHVTLIPKKCMMEIIGMKGGTVDGLHLSQRGHDAFAQMVKAMLVTGSGKA